MKDTMKKITVESKESREVIDITDLVEEKLKEERVVTGLCHLFLTYTTAALATCDLDPGTDLDMLDAFSELVPKLSYRHPHNPAHVKDHIMGTLIGASLTIPFDDKKLILGTWQRVVLFEFDGPREREIVVSIIESN